jgi:hypothetical protein
LKTAKFAKSAKGGKRGRDELGRMLNMMDVAREAR